MKCELCDDTGWEPIVIEGVRRVRRCGCWHQQHPSQVLQLPAYFAAARLENYQSVPGTELALSAAHRWLKGSHDLYLSGPVGCGKSRLAASLANETVALGSTAAFADVSGLIDRARAAEFDADKLDPLVQVKAVDVLILDDVGAVEKASDYTLRVLLGIVNDRMANRRRTIWTSNLTLDQLAAHMQDERIASRIAGVAEVVWMRATDFRVAGPKAWAVTA